MGYYDTIGFAQRGYISIDHDGPLRAFFSRVAIQRVLGLGLYVLAFFRFIGLLSMVHSTPLAF